MNLHNKLKLEQAFHLCCEKPNCKVLFAVSSQKSRKELLDHACEIADNDVLVKRTTSQIIFSNGSKIFLNTPECSLGYSVHKVWVDEATSVE